MRPMQRQFSEMMPALTKAMWPRKQAVIARCQCIYATFDAAPLPRNERNAALRLHLQRITPYPSAETAYQIVWQQQLAQIWIWNSKQEETGRTAVVESRYYAPPESQLPQWRLVSCVQGVEAQYWSEERLLASQWFSILPTEQQWRYFCRSTGFKAATLPQISVSEHAQLTKPWGKTFRLQQSELNHRLLSRVGWVGAWSLIALFSWQTSQWWQEAEQLELLEQQNRQRAQQLERPLRDKQSAETARQQLQQLVRYIPEHSQLQLMMQVLQVSQQLAPDSLYNWNYHPRQLTFTLNSDIDPLTLIQHYQQLPWVGEVRSRPAARQGELMIEIRFAAQNGAAS